MSHQSMQSVTIKVRRFFARLPYILLITHFTVVRIGLVVLIGIISLLVVGTLLYGEGVSGEMGKVERPVVLDVDTIDELELWVEERQTERERVIIPSQRNYFES